MGDLIVRPATSADAEALAGLIDGFAKGHPAERHVRSVEAMRNAFWGDRAVVHAVLAERGEVAAGFGMWRRSYDVFWSMHGGEAVGLYVIPSLRGLGVAACIIAAMCASIREQGGRFLQAAYEPELAAFYERVGVGRPERACHISAGAFQQMAALAGKPVREIIRAMPDRALNYAPGLVPAEAD